MSFTIPESFRAHLPDTYRENLPDTDPRLTGSSANADAPAVAFLVKVDVWTHLGRQLLQGLGTSLDHTYLAAWESTRILRNEGDVQCAASPQLMNPVDLVLGASHSTPIRAFNEYIVKTARPDRVWVAETSTGRKNIAVLDYKRVGTILPHEIKELLNAGAIAQRTGNFGFPLNDTGKTTSLLKIATNYATVCKTRYIAIFDWDYLLLLVMEKVEDNNGGDWCRLTLVHDRSQMRLALLGFLEGAYRANIGKNNDHLEALVLPQSTVARRQPSERIARNPKQYYGSRSGDGDDDNDQYTYSGQLGSIREVSSTNKYGREASSSRYAKETPASRYGKERAYASAGDDFGMGRLTLDPSRRGETPRSKDQKIADYCRDLESRHEASRREASRPTNPATSSSQRPGYDYHDYDPRYRR